MDGTNGTNGITPDGGLVGSTTKCTPTQSFCEGNRIVETILAQILEAVAGTGTSVEKHARLFAEKLKRQKRPTSTR